MITAIVASLQVCVCVCEKERSIIDLVVAKCVVCGGKKTVPENSFLVSRFYLELALKLSPLL